MKLAIIGCLMAFVQPAMPQRSPQAGSGAQWHYAKTENPMTGVSSDSFLLDGIYLTPPSVASAHVPTLAVQCVNGKFKGALLSVGAVVKSLPPQPGVGADQLIVDMRLDENKPDGDQWSIGNDRQTLLFDQFSLTKLLTGKKLWGRLGNDEPLTKRVRVGVVEALGSQVVIQFEMPQDATQLVDSCGLLGKRNMMKR